MNGFLKKWGLWLAVAGVLIVTFSALAPSLRNDLSNLDDNNMISENMKIRELSRESLRTMFTSFHEFLYHPLVLLSYAVEYKFFGLNPRAYHTTNLVIHLINTLLVFWLILLLSKNAAVSLAVALLFGIHPLHVESVAWATERKDLMYAIFFLAAFISYLYYARDRRYLFFHISVAFFILSLLSKPMGVTLPFLALLADYSQGRRLDRKAVIEKVPYVVLAVLFGVITLFAHYPSGLLTRAPRFDIAQKIFVAAHNVLFYLGKMVLPVRLCAFYQYPRDIARAMPVSYLASPFILLALIAVMFATLRYTKKAVFGGLFYLIAVSPVLQFLPIGDTAAPADRFTYIPAIGIFYIAAEGVYWLYEKYKRLLTARIIIAAVCAAAVCVLFFQTRQRCAAWKDSITIWTDVIRCYPSFQLARVNRGAAYEARGLSDLALADYSEAIRCGPPLCEPWYNRAALHNSKQEYRKALEDLDQALRLDPYFVDAYNSRGIVYYNMKRYDEALADFNRLFSISPGDANVYLNRGNVYLEKGEIARAIIDYTEAIRLDPRYSMAHAKRALAFNTAGDPESAIRDATAAVGLAPNSAYAYFVRATVYDARGDLTAALEDTKKTIALQPRDPQWYVNAGVILNKMGRCKEAVAYLDAALNIDPHSADAHYNRGNAYHGINEKEKAVADYCEVIRLSPPNPMAVQNRAMCYFQLGRYEDAWNDVRSLQAMNYPVHEQFLKDLKKATEPGQ